MDTAAQQHPPAQASPDTGRRLFFALWPDDRVREALLRSFSQSPQFHLRARKVAPTNVHITLHFIGQVKAEQQACLQAAAASIRAEPFELQLDRYGHFHQARVFWLGCSQTPDALKRLHASLAEAFLACAYTADRRPFSPHVTLLRKLLKPGPILSPQPVIWPVTEFVLVESVSTETGVFYRVMERYPLG